MSRKWFLCILLPHGVFAHASSQTHLCFIYLQCLVPKIADTLSSFSERVMFFCQLVRSKVFKGIMCALYSANKSSVLIQEIFVHETDVFNKLPSFKILPSFSCFLIFFLCKSIFPYHCVTSFVLRSIFISFNV